MRSDGGSTIPIVLDRSPVSSPAAGDRLAHAGVPAINLGSVSCFSIWLKPAICSDPPTSADQSARRAINGLSARPCRRSWRSRRSCRDRPGLAAAASALAFRTGPVDRQTASSNDLPLRGYNFGARTRSGHSLSTVGRYTSSNRSQMTGMLRLGVRPMRLHSRPK
jgi:hypothetical protein